MIGKDGSGKVGQCRRIKFVQYELEAISVFIELADIKDAQVA